MTIIKTIKKNTHFQGLTPFNGPIHVEAFAGYKDGFPFYQKVWRVDEGEDRVEIYGYEE